MIDYYIFNKVLENLFELDNLNEYLLEIIKLVHLFSIFEGLITFIMMKIYQYIRINLKKINKKCLHSTIFGFYSSKNENEIY